MKRTCKCCGATAGETVVRSKVQPKKWGLDLDLATEYPEAWHRPTVVGIRPGSDICGYCKMLSLEQKK